MEENDINGYLEHKRSEPEPEDVQRARVGLPPKSNKERQKAYRDRLKAKLGDSNFKKQQAEAMKAYRKQRAEAFSVDEQKITNKEQRGMVQNLLKTIEQRIITMIQEQKSNPAIPIYFEAHIKPNEIERVLVNITNDMDNEEVVQAFTENERKNPRNLKKTASEKTFRKYLTDINKIRKDYFGITDKKLKVFNDFEFLRDTDKVLKILKDNYSHTTTSYSTMVNSISSILARLNNYNDIYNNVYKPLNIELAIKKKTEQLDSENRLTEKEKQNFMTWDKIVSLEDAVKNTNINPVENLVIFYLYTQLPPRRLEYGSLVIQIENQFEDDNKTNYVILDSKLKTVKRIILNSYKTSKTYGKYVIENVSKKLSEAIAELIKEQDYKAGENLFMNTKGKAYGNSFSSRLKDVFVQAVNKPITLNILRHSFVSYHIRGNISNKKKTEYAMAMGHSLETQDLYRRYEEEELKV
jgi:integrase